MLFSPISAKKKKKKKKKKKEKKNNQRVKSPIFVHNTWGLGMVLGMRVVFIRGHPPFWLTFSLTKKWLGGIGPTGSCSIVMKGGT